MQPAPLRDPGIYAIRNVCNGRVYVGGTVYLPNRFRSHRCDLRKGRHRNAPLQADWDSFGPDAFEFTVLERLTSEEGMLAAEQRWMDRFSDRYNRCPLAGTPLGIVRTEEARRNVAEAAKRRPRRTLSDEHRARIAAAARGRRHTQETIEKMRATHRRIAEARA